MEFVKEIQQSSIVQIRLETIVYSVDKDITSAHTVRLVFQKTLTVKNGMEIAATDVFKTLN